jgi:hypothetical protein
MSTVTQSTPKQETAETITTTVVFPRELWKRVRIAAAENDTSAQQICADGLELALKKLAARKGKPS